MMGKWKRYYPIKLIDVVTGKVNSNYVLMYVTDFIDAFDIEKSSYRYNEKYNFYSFIPTETYLNEKECAGHDVFRCCRSVASIYVSERVKAIVEKMDWFCFLPTIEHGKGQLGMTKSGKQMSESWLFGKKGNLSESRVYDSLIKGGMSEEEAYLKTSEILDAYRNGQVESILSKVDEAGNVTTSKLDVAGNIIDDWP